jgi:hypothetical protein
MHILMGRLALRRASGRSSDHRWHMTILKERILEFKRPNAD